MSTEIEGQAPSLVSDHDPLDADDDILGPEEAYKVFDLQARAMVGMSGEELARR